MDKITAPLIQFSDRCHREPSLTVNDGDENTVDSAEVIPKQ